MMMRSSRKYATKRTYTNTIVTQLEHGYVGELFQILDLFDFVGAQVQFLQLDQFIKIFNLCYPIEAQVQDSTQQK